MYKRQDQAYADAMQAAYMSYPDDADVACLYAESLMNLQPWDYWTNEGEPKGRALEFVTVLDGVLDNDPYHPGANHFYIHAVEASGDPDRAVPAAERLTSIVPGSGHLVHMPSHIFIRVGRYADAAQSNIDAIAADQSYFELAPPARFYHLYYAHNIHFLAYAGMMSGQYERAIAAARQLEAEIPEEALREMAPIAEGVMPTTLSLIHISPYPPPMTTDDFDAFKARRELGNARVLETDHLGIKRFFRLDTDAYTDRSDQGGLDEPTKELLGLVASSVLRCNDCIDYHLERCVDVGLSEKQIEDALNIALIVGGSIVIPHLRHARLTLDALRDRA